MNELTTNEVLPYVKFLFEVDNPSLEECYRQGYQMSLDGAEESEDPYAGRGQKESEYWLQGWWDACYGVEPMFDLELMASVHADTKPEIEWQEESAANEGAFEDVKESKITTIAKVAAAVAGAFLSYQVIDMIA